MNHFTEIPPAEDCTSRRALYEIVRSCLMTTFACTWIALHPDVPRSDGTHSGSSPSRWANLKGRFKLTIGALIAPEFMVLWAIGERLLAKKIAEEYNRLCNTTECVDNPRWTITHGFFLLMNGFMLYDERGQLISPITPNILFQALKTKEVDRWVTLLAIPEEEIEDKSKGDFFTELVVVAQTTWFGVGCIGRIASGLPLVELEIITLAFATMNIVTFTMWWNKPLNVNLSIPITVTYPEMIARSSLLPVATSLNRGVLTSEQDYCRMATVIGPYFLVKLRSARRVPAKKVSPSVEPFLRTFGLPFSCVNEALVLARLMPYRTLSFRLMPILITTIFASFHFSSWSTDFPSTAEGLLWRLSSVTYFLVPLTSWFFLRLMHDNRSGMNLGLCQDDQDGKHRKLRKVVRQFSLLSFPAYVFARFILLIVALSSLRSLPDSAFLDVQWSRHIPHFA